MFRACWLQKDQFNWSWCRGPKVLKAARFCCTNFFYFTHTLSSMSMVSESCPTHWVFNCELVRVYHFYHCNTKNMLQIPLSEHVNILFLYLKMKQFDFRCGQIWILSYLMTLMVNFASPAVHLSCFMTVGRDTVNTVVSAYLASLPFL